MTMVIGLGLSDLLSGRDDEAHSAVLRALVEQRFTRLVRDVVGAGEAARVIEARRDGEAVTTRVLPEKEAAPILSGLARTDRELGTFASFSWDEADALLLDIEPFTLRMDDEPTEREVDLTPVARRARVADFSSTYLSGRHPGVEVAKGILQFAELHRLIVHTS